MIPIKYNIKSLIVRRVGTLMTVFGVALTVTVFVSFLAMVNGLQSAYVNTGDPRNLLLLRQSAQVETNSFFNRDIKPIVETMDGVEKVAGEIIIIINHPRATGETTNVIVRGISENSMELRPTIQMAEGRMFRSGLRELIVSQTIANRFKGLKLGDSVKLRQTHWNVVGIFDATNTAYDSEIWADYNELSGEFERPIYSSLLVQCADEAALRAVREELANDRRIRLDVLTQEEYFRQQAGAGAGIQVLGYFIGVIMAIGSSFAVMNTMYAATAYRTREIATLRVLGFKRRNIMLSFMIESLVLAVIGGAVGCIMALPVHGISTGTANFVTFSEVVFQFRITPELMLQGMVFAAIMGLIGGLLPARLAARMTITRALRTEV
ncbi:MAG: ABC transporter permease [Acidobacteria bacterium]|nr:ABC transporter permease [Acidobacteriota bacterium]